MSDYEQNSPGSAAPVSLNKQDNIKSWERDTLERLLFATLQEQRRARRWNIFFKLLIFLYLFGPIWCLLGSGQFSVPSGQHTALVNIEGVIAQGESASADNIISGLRDAFENPATAGVVLRINSPGGSPVQAGYIFREIKRLREKHPKIPVYAVITDLGASAAYYIAAAADKIYADQASIVGSIGVVMNGFGFTDAMKKLGVERRLLTAGEHKGLLDPFSPVKEDEVAHLRVMLDDIHNQFISAVKDGRGTRIKDSSEVFSGLVWTGQQSLELGLIDGLGSSSYVAREVIGAEDIVDYTHKQDFFDRLTTRLEKSLGFDATKQMFWNNLN